MYPILDVCHPKDERLSIPQLVRAVWEACCWWDMKELSHVQLMRLVQKGVRAWP